MEKIHSVYYSERKSWRKWLEQNFETQAEIWLEYPKKHSGKKRILYNDAVEEALCFGWIDSTVKTLNPETTIQRFCPRRANSSFSQPNRERLKWLLEAGLVHDTIREELEKVVSREFIFPEDILAKLQEDKTTWHNYQRFSAAYQRIRIAYIESARKRPEEFTRRLQNFLARTKANQLIKGYGGIDKYY